MLVLLLGNLSSCKWNVPTTHTIWWESHRKSTHAERRVCTSPTTCTSLVQDSDFLLQQILATSGQTNLGFLVMSDATSPPLSRNKVPEWTHLLDQPSNNKTQWTGVPLYQHSTHRNLPEHQPRQVLPCPATPAERMRSHPRCLREGWRNQVSVV